MAIKSSVLMAAHSFLVPIYLISICSDCQLKKLTYLYACWIMHMRHYLQVGKWNAKSGQKCLRYWGNLEPSMLAWWQKCPARIVEHISKNLTAKIQTFLIQIGWDIFFHHIWWKFGQVYDVITWLICISFLKTGISLECSKEIFKNS